MCVLGEKTFAHSGLDWQRHVSEKTCLAVRDGALLVRDATLLRERYGWGPVTEFDRMAELMFEHEGRR